MAKQSLVCIEKKIIAPISIRPKIWEAVEIVSEGYGISASELAETLIWDGLQKLAKEIIKLEVLAKGDAEKDE